MYACCLQWCFLRILRKDPFSSLLQVMGMNLCQLTRFPKIRQTVLTSVSLNSISSVLLCLMGKNYTNTIYKQELFLVLVSLCPPPAPPSSIWASESLHYEKIPVLRLRINTFMVWSLSAGTDSVEKLEYTKYLKHTPYFFPLFHTNALIFFKNLLLCGN